MDTQDREFDLLKFRVTGLTDRDAPSLYGEAPERDLFKLWADKIDMTDSSEDVGLSESMFAANAVRFIQDQTGVSFHRAALVNPAIDFLRAEADLYSLEHRIAGRVYVLNPGEYARIGEAPKNIDPKDLISRRHWIELQHLMTVAGLDNAYFVATVDGTQAFRVLILRDLVFTSNHVAECIQFWDHVRRGAPPPGVVIPPDVDPDSDEAQEELPLVLGDQSESIV